jgi:hypothetical protein
VQASIAMRRGKSNAKEKGRPRDGPPLLSQELSERPL